MPEPGSDKHERVHYNCASGRRNHFFIIILLCVQFVFDVVNAIASPLPSPLSLTTSLSSFHQITLSPDLWLPHNEWHINMSTHCFGVSLTQTVTNWFVGNCVRMHPSITSFRLLNWTSTDTLNWYNPLVLRLFVWPSLRTNASTADHVNWVWIAYEPPPDVGTNPIIICIIFFLWWITQHSTFRSFCLLSQIHLQTRSVS